MSRREERFKVNRDRRKNLLDIANDLPKATLIEKIVDLEDMVDTFRERLEIVENLLDGAMERETDG